MSVQQFCLRWNNHQPNFISVCSSLLHNGTLVDVTLAAEGRQLQAHKIVLSACSSYFQTLFTSNPCQHPIVILKDVQYDDLKTMVDFMYYGEVNVSQEQLPHILKTAEMLKIKGLAEMPTDPANLTKSESKSTNEPTDLVGSGSSGSNGQSSSGVASGGLGSSAGGSMSDSLWEQQHHHGQHSDTQFQSHHHQQQQNSQTQTSQQQQQHHHQLRRTPSPLGSGASPATRRKRLRKSSNNGSGDRTNSEEQHNTSLDSGNTASGISLTQMGQMSFGTGAGTISGMPTHSLHASKLLKESTSTDVEPHPQDDSLDGGHGHVHMQIKPEVDMSSVQQSMPLDISAATTPSEHDAPNSQSSHSDISQPSNVAVKTIVSQPECSPCAVNMAMSPSPTSLLPQQQQPQTQLQHQHSQQQPMGTKRNRVLTRQPRVKRDSDSLSNAQASPEPMASCVDVDPFRNSPGSSSHSNFTAAHSHQLHTHHHLLTVPPRIERHSSEPAPSLTPTSPHLLSVPQSTPFLMKQHSDPLLPTQHSLSSAGALIVGTGGTNPFAPLHRQYSHPLSGTSSVANTSNVGTSHITSVSLHQSHHISLPESMYTSGGSPPPIGSSQYVVPQQIVTSGSGGGSNEVVGTMSVSSTSTSPLKVLTLPQFTTTYIDDSSTSGRTNSPTTTPSIAGVQPNTASVSSAPLERVRSTEGNTPPPASKFRTSKPASSVLLSERIISLHPGAPATGSSSFEHLPSLRVRSEELQRSVSSPQTSREIITLENPRSSHCPVIRPGPALGCNFCWNTIDGHGRILRRKTKYHCPECQTNLCIVPCFQEYHERQNSEAANTLSGNDSNSKSFSGATGRSGSGGGNGVYLRKHACKIHLKNQK
ncbi:longitudinals lacking protein, isoforms F/I/K/T isoform X1 [Anastrepha obliqua]|uniref:longitudinals lacking protein, isoforms F/I/K/T isoform X1 n=1 Tax=Anastrepha obliqua TaxID=95512 RepID=UPI00240A86D1|nr:longitudinals lacking protein, isoforms F/I/K/T isoform X1 [Anastrepha obliqua]XP_054732039.1 longitudinals lacking protein, isoforms F/I/K/T isoform X1 [Anastrepha obliqua]XP_054732040.1 longitudinals lacking protein, isoforms F/I/K/T isoform X1 [Anastrepha obliqua]XP_054732041.1 longitudinals lacking protein, isoforms F/I/K/T isoform X1 [Anastrepha obliqua]XP_054732042.1 longitudinals lacking protein, isoforms F/I/K/T isoform X1 [Anastrepha obliqua]XP_054732043.1 longitudinals lacking pro